MPNYSPEEIKGFQEKDLRINRVAVIKSLIESGRNSANEVEENCMIVEQYVKFIYNVIETKEQTKNGTKPFEYVKPDWVLIGTGTIPTQEEIKVLDLLWIEYRQLCSGKEQKVSLNPVLLCDLIIKVFGKYPTNKNSISKVLSKIKLEQVLTK